VHALLQCFLYNSATDVLYYLSTDTHSRGRPHHSFSPPLWSSLTLVLPPLWSHTHFHQSGLASSCCKSDLSSPPPLAFAVSRLVPWLFIAIFEHDQHVAVAPFPCRHNTLATCLEVVNHIFHTEHHDPLLAFACHFPQKN
jgi:hypothetical protein